MSLIYFRKIDENDEQLHYVFGWDYELMTRSLVIYKKTGHIELVDGSADYATSKAGMGIYIQYKRDNSWPEYGYCASG